MKKQQTRSELKSQLFHKDSELVSPSVMSPQTFKWKVAALIISVLIAILLIINILLIIQISNIPQVKNNYTYLSDIATSTQILQTKQQFLMLNNNFNIIYGQSDIYFQNAQLMIRLDRLSQNNIRFDIFQEQNEKMLFLFQLIDQDTKVYKFGIYMNGAFPIPEGNDFNLDITYYSFQIDDQRKSSIFSLNSQLTYLKMTNPRSLSPLSCQTYQFRTGNPQGVTFGYLQSLISFTLTGNSLVTVDDSNQKYRCFQPEYTSQGFYDKLVQILGWDYRDQALQLTLQFVEVYHLEE